MARKKEKPITVTHTEILSFAIQALTRLWEKEKADTGRIRQTDPAFAEEMLEGSMWRAKLRVLLQLYRIETGTDYGCDLGLD